MTMAPYMTPPCSDSDEEVKLAFELYCSDCTSAVAGTTYINMYMYTTTTVQVAICACSICSICIICASSTQKKATSVSCRE